MKTSSCIKALVTGANGFLGSWLCKTLSEQGFYVRAFVRKGSDVSDLQGIPCDFAYGDITQYESIIPALNEIDVVFHLAGIVAYRASDQAMMEKVNVDGTSLLVAACKAQKTPQKLEQKIPDLIFVSTVGTIGVGFSPSQILSETAPYNASCLGIGYFESKRRAEEIVLASADQMRVVIVNPSTMYGAGDAKKGSRSVQLKVAQAKLSFYTSGGVSVASVEDVAQGIVQAFREGKPGERYILAGENMTLKQVFHHIAEAAGVQPPRIFLPNFVIHAVAKYSEILEKSGKKSPLASQTARLSTLFHWFDSSKAQRELGYRISNPVAAIHRSVSWMKKKGLLDK